jgi:acyl-CoA synthetase (AMP-forming)/AMP-acid ligase II
VVHRHGKPVAAIVSTEDLQRLEALEDAHDRVDARAALREAERQGTIPLDVVLKRYGLDHLLIRAAGAPRRRATRPTSRKTAKR